MRNVEYRRTLPHFQPQNVPIFVTWRLFGSIALARRDKLLLSDRTPGRTFVAKDRMLDKARGPKWLSDPQIAAFVADRIRLGADRAFYNLHAWVIMPNHVHLLITPNVPLRRITQGLKGSTARFANATLGLTGSPLWQDESWDRWVRSGDEFRKIIRYIEGNPVLAGLADTPQDWPWSSASLR